MATFKLNIKSVPTTIQLDNVCYRCARVGNTEDCETCGGKGYILTEEGEELLGFITRHLDLRVRLITVRP